MRKKILAAMVSAFSLALIVGLLMPGCDEGSGNGIEMNDGSSGTLTQAWPVPTGTLPNVSGQAHASGDYFYVAAGSAGLKIFNKSDLGGAEVGSYATACDALSVFISGSFAYVAQGSCGLVILDITNPVAPVHGGTYNPASFIATDVYVGGTIGSVAGSFHLLDLSTPTAPFPISSRNTTCTPTGIYAGAKDGNSTYAYVAMGTCGIDIFMVANPALPTFIENVNEVKTMFETYPLIANDVFVVGKFLYVADGMGITIFDLSGDATNLEFAADYNSECNTTSVYVSNFIAYVGSSDCGHILYDVSGGGDPGAINPNISLECQNLIAVSIPEDELTNNQIPTCLAPLQGTPLIKDGNTLKDQGWGGELSVGELDLWYFVGDGREISISLSCFRENTDLNLYLFEECQFGLPVAQSSNPRNWESLSYQTVPGKVFYIGLMYAGGPLSPYSLTVTFK